MAYSDLERSKNVEMLNYKREGKGNTNQFFMHNTYLNLESIRAATHQDMFLTENQGFGGATNQDMSLN